MPPPAPQIQTKITAARESERKQRGCGRSHSFTLRFSLASCESLFWSAALKAHILRARLVYMFCSCQVQSSDQLEISQIKLQQLQPAVMCFSLLCRGPQRLLCGSEALAAWTIPCASSPFASCPICTVLFPQAAQLSHCSKTCTSHTPAGQCMGAFAFDAGMARTRHKT